MHVSTLVDSIRQPEYTGANRCLPCTVTNLAIAAVISVVVGAFVPPAGLVLFVVAVAAVYLRGYLVPGTPAFTRRYLPDRLLAVFEKGSLSPDLAALDVETFLVDAGVVVETADDLDLDSDFEAAWYDRMRGLDDGETDVDELAVLAGLPPEEFRIDWHGDAFVALLGQERVGQWESRAAFVADVAAARELAARSPAWADAPLAYRSRVLGALRLFLERCPTCDGEVELAQEVVQSCCRNYDVVAANCVDCGARLLEADFDTSALEGDAA
ncbi:hypothetical protein [Salinirarus marinus]|uniref:hypothetical protein n=1 Tax=Salinirarus marinus TaxID=3068310 RepID=UPI003C6C77AE